MSYDDNQVSKPPSATDRLEQIARSLDVLGPSQITIEAAVRDIRQIVYELRDQALAEPDTQETSKATDTPISEQIGVGWTAVLKGGGGPGMTVIDFIVQRVGGPSPAPMFIADSDPEDRVLNVTCAWHDEQDRPCVATYPFEALQLTPPETGRA